MILQVKTQEFWLILHYDSNTSIQGTQVWHRGGLLAILKRKQSQCSYVEGFYGPRYRWHTSFHPCSLVYHMVIWSHLTAKEGGKCSLALCIRRETGFLVASLTVSHTFNLDKWVLNLGFLKHLSRKEYLKYIFNFILSVSVCFE